MAERPAEHVMVARALVAGAAAAPVAYAAGFAAGGPGDAASALIGVAVVVLNFAAHGMSLAWAARTSPVALQAVALGGFLVRMGIILGILVLLDGTEFFSPLVFGLAAASSIGALLVYEARLVARGLGGQLEVPS
jgi:hypothetical protein